MKFSESESEVKASSLAGFQNEYFAESNTRET